MSNRHLLRTSVPLAHLLHLAQLELFSSLFHSLCLSDPVVVCIHPRLSRHGSLNDRSDSLSAFVIMWLCRSSMRCKRRTTWTTSSVSVCCNVRGQIVETSRLNLPRSFNHNPWQWSPAPSVSCDLLRQLQFWSHHLPRSATRTFPDRRFPCITRCLSCPTFASHNSSLGDAQNCSCSIKMTNEDSFSNFEKPNVLSKLRHWPPPNLHPTVGHVITFRWPLRNHFHSQHTRESPRLELLSFGGHCRISK